MERVCEEQHGHDDEAQHGAYLQARHGQTSRSVYASNGHERKRRIPDLLRKRKLNLYHDVQQDRKRHILNGAEHDGRGLLQDDGKA